MTLLHTTMKRREAALPIKKEIQEFIIATENLYRLLSNNNKALSCHEVEILRCCLEELSTIEDDPSVHQGRRIKVNRGSG
jgi:hypothetical protein